MTTFTILTSGSAHTLSDSEKMAGLLTQAKFERVNDVESADIVIFNSCAAKELSEELLFTPLDKVKTEYPHKMIIITGCIPQVDPLNLKLKSYCLLGTGRIHQIVQVAEEALNDNVVQLLEMDELAPLNLPRVRRNSVVGIVPITLGCPEVYSSYKTKLTHVTLQSYSITEIKKEVELALKDGVREIWLTSEDGFSYGFDIGADIVTLLKELVTIPGNFMLRLGVGNLVHLAKIKDGLVEMYKHPKIFKYLHLPLQAGDNTTLTEMKRRYTVEEFVAAVHDFKEAVPEITIMTDIIVGYPTETDEQYQGTISVIRKTTPDCVNISRFWPRPGTKGAKLQPLSGEIVNHRSKTLSDIVNNISKMENERWQDWSGEIIIDEKGAVDNQWMGHNFAYKPVIVEGDYKLGDVLNVKVVKTTTFDLRGEVVKK